MDREQMFVLNIALLIGILMLLGILLAVAIVAWTGIRAWLFTRSQRSDKSDPPSAAGSDRGLLGRERGMCENCGLFLDRIVRCPDGARLCPQCHARLRSATQ